ncbi:MAG TPA: integrin alpha, partial [Azospirillaceae bacterium]|nr:integrin alpha [Azospirillaceae bacterium]
MNTGLFSEADCKLLGPGEPALAGVSVAGPGDVNGDGHADLLVGAPGDYLQGRSAGAAYLVYGPRSGIVELSAAELQIVGAQPGDTLGYSVA